MSFRLPLWLYWTLATLGVAAAGYFSLTFDFSILEEGEMRRLLFIVWGGPLTLVIAASLVTYLKRSSSEGG